MTPLRSVVLLKAGFFEGARRAAAKLGYSSRRRADISACMARLSRVILCKTRAAAFGRVMLLRWTNGIPCLLSASTTRRIRTEPRERVSAVIIGLTICIGLLGWALSV